MDTSKEYIKMCDWKGIQDGWEPKQSDLTIDRIFLNEKGIEKFISFVWWNLEKGNNIWLPRQDQLQEMTTFSSIRVMLNHIRTFSYDIKGRNFTSMEQLWLAFVMKEKFGKTWKDEKWQ